MGSLPHAPGASAPRTWRLVAAVTLLAAPVPPHSAAAAPPPAGSEDYAILMPFKHWVGQQRVRGEGRDDRYCCTISDGRLVRVRIVGDHYEVRPLHPETLTDPPHGWVPVPPRAVLRAPNPTGYPVAWFAGDTVACFAPADGI